MVGSLHVLVTNMFSKSRGRFSIKAILFLLLVFVVKMPKTTFLVGGIFTVIKSKSDISVRELGDRFVLVGPYNERFCNKELERCEIPHKEVVHALDLMQEKGVKTHTGKWLAKGSPFVILIDIASVASRLREWRKDFLEQTRIRIPWEDCEVNDALLFGYSVAWFLGQVLRFDNFVGGRLTSVFTKPTDQWNLAALKPMKRLRSQWPPQEQMNIVVHFHEWISAIGLILCRQRGLDVATIFTTHATLIGRHLSAGKENINGDLKQFDCDKEAADRGFYYRYCIERVAAKVSHVLTTVSKITGEETLHFLGRYPGIYDARSPNGTKLQLVYYLDHITPNGISGSHDVSTSELESSHQRAKEKIDNFVKGHFFGHLNFDLDETIYMFIAGRYEYYNKGGDLFIESLARLNYRLKCEESSVTVVAFVIMPAGTHGYNEDSLRLHASNRQLQKAALQLQDVLSPTVVKECMSGLIPKFENLEDADEQDYVTNFVNKNTRPEQYPPICTHNMNDDNKDLVLKEFRRCHLFNHPEDRVKVVFHPEFLSSNSELFPMEYEEFVHGCHLGVFPSYYEPWGYTPAECAVSGIPSITTNMSGYGRYIADLIPNPKEYGIYIVDRKFRSVEDSVRQLTDYLHDFTKQSRSEQRQQRQHTQLLRDLLDWKVLGVEYHKARQTAVQRCHPETEQISGDRKLEATKSSFLNKLRTSTMFNTIAEKLLPAPKMKTNHS